MKRHNFDPISFVIGVFVTGIGIIFAAGIEGVTWLGPALLGGVGVICLTGAAQTLLKERTGEG